MSKQVFMQLYNEPQTFIFLSRDLQRTYQNTVLPAARNLSRSALGSGHISIATIEIEL